MFEVLVAYLRQRMPLSAEHVSLIESTLIPKYLEKGEILLREGEIAKYGAFVAKGCLRSYVVDNKGKEHIVQFAPENWWLSDTNSLFHQTPTPFFIDALEPTDVLLLDAPSHLKLVQLIPGYGASFQAGFQKHVASKDHRIIATLTATAEERFENFLKTYPTIAQRVPQHMLASYLGVTPETLSRIRKKWSVKK
ncbi:MAG TPA: Crp/Fnr family transcriptional regulator [Chitinophagaceae bacterium]|nr:Crp/Fnr family transcriptional regulator [Chitinophagaceae bacterium]